MAWAAPGASAAAAAKARPAVSAAAQAAPAPGGGGGGGGLGAGGDIFVQQGASLTVEGGSLTDGTVTKGQGGGGGGAGKAFGAGIFLQGHETITFGRGGSDTRTTTIAGDIADENGSFGNAGTFGVGGVAIDAGDGTVILSGDNTFTGGVEVKTGALAISAAANVGSGVVTIDKGAVLDLIGSFSLQNNVTIGGTASISVSDHATATLAGHITNSSAPGSLIVTGGGKLVAAFIQYSGDTEIADDSTLEIKSAITGSGKIAFGSGGALRARRERHDDKYDRRLRRQARIVLWERPPTGPQ